MLSIKEKVWIDHMWALQDGALVAIKRILPFLDSLCMRTPYYNIVLLLALFLITNFIFYRLICELECRKHVSLTPC